MTDRTHFCFSAPAGRFGYFGRGNLGEGGQWIHLEFSTEDTRCSGWAGSASERGLSSDRSGRRAPHPGLSGLLWSCSREQVYAAAGTSHHLHLHMSVNIFFSAAQVYSSQIGIFLYYYDICFQWLKCRKQNIYFIFTYYIVLYYIILYYPSFHLLFLLFSVLCHYSHRLHCWSRRRDRSFGL